MTHGLNGRKILITRARSVSGDTTSDIETMGGQVVHIPVMTFQSIPLQNEQYNWLHQLENFDWLAFTSGNGVRYFMNLVNQLGLSLPKALKIAVVGAKTAKVLDSFGITPDLVPDKYTGEQLARQMIDGNTDCSVLLPLGRLANKDVENVLQEAGLLTYRIDVYDTIPNQEVKPIIKSVIEKRNVDVVTFMSPSAVRFFNELSSDFDTTQFWSDVVVACIGEKTAEEVFLHGIKPDVIPNVQTARALIESIAEYYNNKFLHN